MNTSNQQARTGTTISVANAKGGVGKTTLSVNLAYELHFQGYKVAMIDLDSQCDLTKVYQPTDYKGATIVDLLQKRCKVSEAMIPVEKNLFLIAGSREISAFKFKGSEHALLRIVTIIKQKGIDFIIVDHPPALHEIALAGYIASDFVLIVSEAEAFSVANLDQLTQDLKAIKESYQPKLKTLGIVMNKIDRRRNLTKATLQECQSAFGKVMFESMVSTDTAIPNSLDQCIPVRNLRWRSRTVSQFTHVAAEMMARMV